MDVRNSGAGVLTETPPGVAAILIEDGALLPGVRSTPALSRKAKRQIKRAWGKNIAGFLLREVAGAGVLDLTSRPPASVLPDPVWQDEDGFGVIKVRNNVLGVSCFIKHTFHSEIRSRKRGVRQGIMETLLLFGAPRHAKWGAERIQLERRSLKPLQEHWGNELGLRIYNEVRKFYIVTKADSAVTVGRINRRCKR